MTTCAKTFPGRPESAAAARRWAGRCLPGCPAAADVLLCVSELVTNAVTHSRSGLVPGGTVRVRIAAAPGVWVRIEVRDDGPADWAPAPFRDGTGSAPGGAAGVKEPGELASGGRGLWLVRELAGGQAGAGGGGRTGPGCRGPRERSRRRSRGVRAGWR